MSFLKTEDLTAEQLRGLIELGLDVKANPSDYVGSLAGRSIGLFFQKPSLRTVVSCDIGAAQLGAHSITISNDQTGMGTRESPGDVGRVLDRYLDLLAMRVFSHENLETIDEGAEIPIVNLLSDLEHPCQSIADVMTLAENGLLTETTAFIGDGNNVCHSLMMAITMAGGSIRVATAPGYEPHDDYVEAARRYGTVTVTNDANEAVAGAAAVYTDVWASMGQESEAAAKKQQFERFQVDTDLFMRADPDAIFLHCLPAHRGEEVTDEVIDHPRSRVFDQAENRLHSFKAVLLDQLR